MNDQNLDGRLTIIAGRPSSGKTTTAMRIAKAYLRNRTNVLFCHAEGPLLLQDTLFEFSGPDDLTFLDYIPDIFMNESDLLVKIGILSPKQESLVVIDTIELFDCEPHEFTKALRNATAKTQTKILVLTQLPRTYEHKPRECAEEYLRRKNSAVVASLTEKRQLLESQENSMKSLLANADRVVRLVEESDPVALKNAYKHLFDRVVVGALDTEGSRPLRFLFKDQFSENFEEFDKSVNRTDGTSVDNKIGSGCHR